MRSFLSSPVTGRAFSNRQAKMAQSAHAYVRGNTLHFYEWLKKHSSQTIAEGPPIWICGDCHVGNIGPLADSEGKIEIQIRDLDQTVVGNPAHDLVRLALSLATAARGVSVVGSTPRNNSHSGLTPPSNSAT
jgi:uncharacterized protein (DUF2252 family)